MKQVQISEERYTLTYSEGTKAQYSKSDVKADIPSRIVREPVFVFILSDNL